MSCSEFMKSIPYYIMDFPLIQEQLYEKTRTLFLLILGDFAIFSILFDLYFALVLPASQRILLTAFYAHRFQIDFVFLFIKRF